MHNYTLQLCARPVYYMRPCSCTLSIGARAQMANTRVAEHYRWVQFLDINDVIDGVDAVAVQQAWVLWEPIAALRQKTSIKHKILRSAAKHCFLVFKLADPGQRVYGQQFQLLRVERQNPALSSVDANQPPTAMANSLSKRLSSYSSYSIAHDQLASQASADDPEARLNLRFTKEQSLAVYIDINLQKQLDDITSLYETDDNGVQLSSIIKFNQGFSLSNLLQLLQQAHNRKPQYNLQDANCVWYVKEVLTKCLDSAVVDQSSAKYIRKFRSKWRTVLTHTVWSADGFKTEEVLEGLHDAWGSAKRGLVRLGGSMLRS